METNARVVLERLVGRIVTTLSGRPNTILSIEGDQVRVSTRRSPQGTLVPIAWVQEGLVDFAVVCSNCHRILHRRVPPLTLNELRSFLQRN